MLVKKGRSSYFITEYYKKKKKKKKKKKVIDENPGKTCIYYNEKDRTFE